MVTLNFDAPMNYNLAEWQIGQSTEIDTALTVVASGTDVGTYPEWINQLTYSGANSLYYSVRFMTDDSQFTAWTDRMYGKYGAGLGYFTLAPSGGNTVYLIPPPASGSAEIPSWLSYNTEYTVTVYPSGISGTASGLFGPSTDYMEGEYEFSFTSEYCPLWSTVDQVRLVVGPIADSIPDDTVNRMIHKMSLTAISKFLDGTNPYGCDYTTIPEQLNRWVTCATGMLLLNAAIAAGGGGGGNTSKRLGGLSISYDGGGDGGSSPGDTRKALEDCMKEAAISIGALQGKSVQWTVQSLNNSFITHPQRDPMWGRQPRQVLDNGTTGPWRDSGEYGTYRKNIG